MTMDIIDEYKEAFYSFLLLTPAERRIVTGKMEEMIASRQRIAENVCACK